MYPEEGIYEAIHRAVLAKFLPLVIREALEENILKWNIKKPSLNGSLTTKIDINWTNTTESNNSQTMIHHEIMIPQTVFYDNEQVNTYFFKL